MNLSTRGASVSVGRRGAVLNLSSRGARATVGIPGSGLSYSTQLTSGSANSQGRSTRQLTAEYRRIASEQRYEAGQAEVDAMERELELLLNTWRSAPPLVSVEALRATLIPQAFAYDIARPGPPDSVADCRAFAKRVRDELVTAAPRPSDAQMGAVIGGVVLTVISYAVLRLVAGDALRLAGAASVGCLSAALFHARLIGNWSRTLQGELMRRLEDWPTERAALQRRYVDAEAAYESSREGAASAWSAHEHARIELLHGVLAGNIEALSTAVTSALEDTDFPFDTDCDVAITQPDTCYVCLDLPEIEDVVPEFRLKALKSGPIKEVKRKKSDRCDAYAHLAAGLAFYISGCVFASAPGVRVVHVAAYTQRKQRGAERIDDDFIYEVAVERSVYVSLDLASVDPLSALQQLRARFERKKDGEFKKAARPDWVDTLFATP